MSFAADLAEVFNSRDFDRLEAMFAADFINHNPLPGPGVEGFKAFWAMMATGLPDLEITLDDSIEGEHETAARYTVRGTHRGAFLGLEPTGRRIEMKTMEFWRFENGMVVEHWDSVNTLEVLQQLQVLPADLLAA